MCVCVGGGKMVETAAAAWMMVEINSHNEGGTA